MDHAFSRKRIDEIVAFENRCPHRQAPLSMGRIDGDELVCRYHGLRFGMDGRCVRVPGSDTIPPNANVRTFPVVEKWSWIWVWLGDPALADPASIPDAFGVDNPEWTMRTSALDYKADYQLLNDNLCDLSHVDFVHETTLGAATGPVWADTLPTVRTLPDGLFVQRWFVDRPGHGGSRIDTWSRYRYLLPGIFLQQVSVYPAGTAQASDFAQPAADPLMELADQQAVTPMGPGRTRYLYASGVATRFATPEMLEWQFAVIEAAFIEDHRMIEAQQAILDQTSPDRPKAFIAHDKAPMMMRRMIERRIAPERGADAPPVQTV